MDEFIRSCNDFADAFEARISVVVFLPFIIASGSFIGAFSWMVTHRTPDTIWGLVHPALLWAGSASLFAGVIFTSFLVKRFWSEDE